MPDEIISVSRDALRAELAELELRLSARLASKDTVQNIDGRVDTLESKIILLEKEQTDLHKFDVSIKARFGKLIASAVTLSLAIIGTCVTLVLTIPKR